MIIYSRAICATGGGTRSGGTHSGGALSDGNDRKPKNLFLVPVRRRPSVGGPERLRLKQHLSAGP